MKMSVTRMIAAVGCGLVCQFVLVAAAPAIDTLIKTGKQPRLAGSVKAVTATDVSIEAGGKLEKVPVTDIEAVEFEGEPSEVKLARGALKSGGDQNAIVQLEKIKPETLTKKEVRQDVAFYHAQALARLALRGAGDVKKAGAAMYDFASKNADSYHYLQAQELLGDLFVADNNIAGALDAYAKLDAAPFDEYKMRAGVARGRALVSQQKYPEALTEFEKVLALPFNPMTQKGTPAESQRFAAVLGRAQCQANTGGYDAAIKELEETVIPNLNPEETQLQALAYNTLGNCYNQKPDGKKPALLAFLHVDVLYNTVPNAHAESLWNLSNIWVEVGKNERGQECLNRLNRLYPGSPWITKKR